MTRRVAVACAPALLGALDFGFLAVAGPSIAADLDLASAYAWLFSAGSVAYGAVVMPAETLLARVAPSRLLAGGLAVGACGIVVLACAGDVATALAGRVLFGAGTGTAAAPALVLLAEEEGDAAFARMGGAIGLGFSAGVALGTAGMWRVALLATAALVIATVVVAGRLAGRRLDRRHGAAGVLRIGAATAGAGAFLAVVRAEPLAGAVMLAVAAAFAAGGWLAVRRRLPPARRGLLVACAVGAATTMSGVGATVLLGLQLGRTPAPDDIVLALFGLPTAAAVHVARRLSGRVGPAATAATGLAIQAAAVLAIGHGLAIPLLAPAVALFGAGHVVANAGAAAAVMRSAGEGTAPAAGLYATGQYLAAGVGALVVVGAGDQAGMAVAAAIALSGVALVALSQRRAPTHSDSRSA